jgi:hypothetical protein
MAPYFRNPYFYPVPPIVRLSGRPRPDQTDEPPDPNAVVGPRTGKRQPHSDATFARVRRLFEQTVLTYHQIAARTGVSIGSISNWAYDGAWKRPLFAPRSNDTVPTARAKAKTKRRELAARLVALAERHVRELEESERVDPDKLAEGMELLRMARLAIRRRPKRRIGDLPEPELFRRPITQLCAAGVDLSHAPKEALHDFLENRERPAEKDLPPRGSRGSRRKREHRWMMQKIEKERP